MKKLNIKIDQIKFDEEIILNDVDLNFLNNGLFLIKGKNGSGKSTLLNIIASNLKINKIKYFVDDLLLDTNKYEKFKNDNIFYCMQDDIIFEKKSVLENLLIPFKYKDLNKAKSILNLLGLEKIMNNDSINLSNGEKARLSLARAIYSDKKIILLDEIFASLDISSRIIIEDYLLKLSLDHLIIYTSNEQISEKTLQNSNIYFINDHKINFIPSKIKHELSNNNVIKDDLNKKKRYFNKNILLTSLFSILMIIFTIFTTINLSLYTPSKQTYRENLILEKYKDISPSILLAIDVNIKKFDKKDIFYKKVPITSPIFFNIQDELTTFDSIMQTTSLDYFIDNFKLINFSSGIESRYPKNESEMIISSNHYLNLLNYFKNLNNDNNEEIDNFIINNNIEYNYQNYKIVGIYQSIEKIDSLNIYNNFTWKYNNDVKSSYAFKIDTPFIYSSKIEGIPYLSINKSNKYLLDKEDVNKLIFVNDKNNLNNPLFINKNNKNVLTTYVYGDNSFLTFSIVGIISLLAIIIFFSYLFYTLNIRRYIFLRSVTYSRNYLLKKSILSSFLINNITFIFSILISFIFTYSYSNFINDQFIFISLPNLITLLDLNTLLFIILFYIISNIIIFIFLYFILLPKNFKKQYSVLRYK